jgi:hypothetical protein
MELTFSTKLLTNVTTSATTEIEVNAMPPISVGVPVVTMIGSLGSLDQTRQTYPQRRSSGSRVYIPFS